MKANKEDLKPGHTIVFKCDEYNNGEVSEFDGEVISVEDTGVHVIYLSGYKSRNDFIPWKDILAKVDKRKAYIQLPNAPYSGRFVVYS